MNQCTFSIIVPAYNTAPFIGKCIDSLLNQTYKDYEIIVIDDGSNDETGRIIDRYVYCHTNISVFHIQNSGVSNARNYGIAKARGKYIVFVDSDDYVDSAFLESMLESKAELYIQGWKDVSEKGDVINHTVFRNAYYEDDIQLDTLLISGELNCICGKRFSTALIKQYSIFFNVTINYGEDTLFVLEYLKIAKSFESSSLCLYHYVQYSDRETLSSVNNCLETIKRAKNANTLIVQLISNNIDIQKRLYMQRMRWVYNNSLVGLPLYNRFVLFCKDDDYRKVVKQNLIIRIKKLIH